MTLHVSQCLRRYLRRWRHRRASSVSGTVCLVRTNIYRVILGVGVVEATPVDGRRSVGLLPPGGMVVRVVVGVGGRRGAFLVLYKPAAVQ